MSRVIIDVEKYIFELLRAFEEYDHNDIDKEIWIDEVIYCTKDDSARIIKLGNSNTYTITNNTQAEIGYTTYNRGLTFRFLEYHLDLNYGEEYMLENYKELNAAMLAIKGVWIL